MAHIDPDRSGAPGPAHVDPDELALLALGEPVGDDVTAHLDDCPDCREELDALRAAVRVGRGTIGSEELARPHERVWRAIVEELDARTPRAGAVDVASSGAAHPSDAASAGPVGAASAPAAVAPASSSSGGSPSRWVWRAWLGLAAVIAVVGLVAAVAPVLRGQTPAPADATVALEPLPGWSGAAGEAEVADRDGSRVLHVELTGADGATGFREVWLLDQDDDELVSLGLLDGDSGDFTLPEDLDLARYRTVDVSAEPDDGDPEHSGDSIVRGELPASS
jgi:hypothetical protein